MPSQENQPKGEMLIYQTEDGATRIDVRFQDETLWLSQMQMAGLFQKDKRTISEHIANLYDERELTQEATVRNFRTVQKEGSREVARDLSLYNLDVAICWLSRQITSWHRVFVVKQNSMIMNCILR